MAGRRSPRHLYWGFSVCEADAIFSNLMDAICENFQQLRSDPVASKECDEEFKAWDVTLADGMGGY